MTISEIIQHFKQHFPVNGTLTEAGSKSQEEYMMHTIMQTSIDENDEEIVIPMRVYS